MISFHSQSTLPSEMSTSNGSFPNGQRKRMDRGKEWIEEKIEQIKISRYNIQKRLDGWEQLGGCRRLIRWERLNKWKS